MIRLGVNIDHLATLREVRKTSYPNLLEASEILATCAVTQITLHLREDRRHIQDADLHRLHSWGKLPLNLEMAATEEMVKLACLLRPKTVTLVPEKREELTTEGGLDVVQHSTTLCSCIKRLKEAGIQVSLFLDPELSHIKAAKELGVSVLELHTGAYAHAFLKGSGELELKRLKQAASASEALGFRVCAGHGLNRDNLSLLVQHLPEIVEYNIGHAIVARAVFVGLETSVKEIQHILEES